MNSEPNRPAGVGAKNPPINTQRQMQAPQQQATQRPVNATQQRPPQQSGNSIPPQPQRPASHRKLPIIPIIIALAVVIGIVVYFVAIKPKNEEPIDEPIATPTPIPEIDYTGSGYEALQTYFRAIASKDPYAIDDAVGTENADSYIAHEFAYTNANEQRLYFVQRICELVKVEYATTPARAEGMEPDIALYNDGEAVTVTVPDYEKISAMIQEDVLNIRDQYTRLGYVKTDLDYGNEMLEFMLRYVTDIQELPTITASVVLPMEVTAEGKHYIVDDSALDDVLFGADALHEMCDVFVKTATDYQPTVEVYEDNPEYAEWHEKLDKYMADPETYADKFALRIVYKTDENGDTILDEEKNPVIKKQYYVLISKKGKDVKEPDEKVLVQQDNPYIVESVIPYNWCGSHFIQTAYEGVYSKVVALGDGTVDNPAGVGTPIITKIQTTSGEFIDAEVTLVNYWVRQDAIDYVETLSKRNHGFTTDSKVDLFVCEFAVKNLSGKKAEVKSGIMLSDTKGNKSTRTGTMFGFTDTAVIEPGETVVMNDWLTSTTLDVKHLAWGAEFNRVYDVVYFAVLAGTPEVPTYSPYSVKLEAVLGYYGSHKYNNQELDKASDVSMNISPTPDAKSGEETKSK